MKSRRRVSPDRRFVRMLIPLVVLTIPGDYYRPILPGVTVLNEHKWAYVCPGCGTVVKTTKVQGSRKKCRTCNHLHTYLPLYDCPNAKCEKKLVYSSQADINSGISCSMGTHKPKPRFIGTPEKTKRHSYKFERNE